MMTQFYHDTSTETSTQMTVSNQATFIFSDISSDYEAVSALISNAGWSFDDDVILGSWSNVIIGFITLTLSAVCVCGNIAVLVIVANTPQLRTTTNVLIGGMLAADMLVGLVVIPASFFIFKQSSADEIQCCHHHAVIGFLSAVCAVITMWSLACVCIDRCLAVSFPLRYNQLMCTSSAAAMLLVISTIATIVAVLPALGWGCYEFIADIAMLKCDLQTDIAAYRFLHLCVKGLVPWIVIVTMFLQIVRSAYAQRRIFALMPVGVQIGLVLPVHQTTPTVNYRRSTLHAMRTLFIISSAILLLWMPYAVVKMLTYFGYNCSSRLLALVACISLSSSTVNPLIFLNNRKFKQRISYIRNKRVSGQSDDTISHTGSTRLLSLSGSTCSSMSSCTSSRSSSSSSLSSSSSSSSSSSQESNIGVSNSKLLATINFKANSLQVPGSRPTLKLRHEAPGPMQIMVAPIPSLV